MFEGDCECLRLFVCIRRGDHRVLVLIVVDGNDSDTSQSGDLLCTFNHGLVSIGERHAGILLSGRDEVVSYNFQYGQEEEGASEGGYQKAEAAQETGGFQAFVRPERRRV
jgi:hypothetical protein